MLDKMRITSRSTLHRHATIVRRMAALLMLACASASAPAQEINAALNEQVLMIPKTGGLFTIQLETTLYKPAGDGPFPLVVINHGKAIGDPHFQARYQPTSAARFFLQRGYAVVVPMRQGFSRSEGSFILGGCNVDSNGRAQAEDVKAVLDHVSAQRWADKSRILVVGQSHGGWTSLAFGTLGYPGVKGLVNFAGGLRQESCAGWESTLARASAAYGAETRVPSLWFYGDNDSYFRPYTFQPMHQSYVAAGAQAELVAFGPFGTDSHAMFGSRSGEAIWQPRLEAFLRSLGLPVETVYPEYGVLQTMPTPPATDFALLTEVEKVPYVRDSGRDGYREFLGRQTPRAFAIAPGGAWGWAENGDDPLARALGHCNRNAKSQTCHLYAVDNQVVWTEQ